MKNYFRLSLIIIATAFLISCSQKKEYEEIVPGSQQFYEFQFTNPEGKIQKSKFLLSVPLNYNSKNEYPLLVCLHGYGSNPEAFAELWKPAADSLGVILIAPQGDKETEEGIGYQWSEGSDLMVLTAMDAAINIANISQDTIYVAGFSMGGTFAYELIYNYPQIFKGAAALSARLPEYYDVESVGFLKGRRFYVTAGELEEETKEDANKLLDMMIKNEIEMQHTIYFDIGHGLPEDTHVEIKKMVKYFFAEEKK